MDNSKELILNLCAICRKPLPPNYMFLACEDCAKKVDYDYYADNENYESKQRK